MFEHGRSLVKQYENYPFQMIGVCCTGDVAAGLATQKKHKLNWRSFNDAGARIEQGYGLMAYPTVFVIDHLGKIQWIGHEFNDDLVAELVYAIK